MTINPLLYLWLFLKASLFSTGGMGNFPILYADLIPLGWATEAEFVKALAIGQISPGPTGLWVISLGYLTYGMTGVLMSLIAITLPPLLVLVIDTFHRRTGEHPAMKGFVRGLGLGVVGISIVVIARLFQGIGFDAGGILIALGSILLGMSRRVPVVVVLTLAALAGILIYG
ncbi:MAG: chromate transporter [Chloroflexi bacterium]|nr:chromate transporter [Chloroflexota bacterium]